MKVLPYSLFSFLSGDHSANTSFERTGFRIDLVQDSNRKSILKIKDGRRFRRLPEPCHGYHACDASEFLDGGMSAAMRGMIGVSRGVGRLVGFMACGHIKRTRVGSVHADLILKHKPDFFVLQDRTDKRRKMLSRAGYSIGLVNSSGRPAFIIGSLRGVVPAGISEIDVVTYDDLSEAVESAISERAASPMDEEVTLFTDWLRKQAGYSEGSAKDIVYGIRVAMNAVGSAPFEKWKDGVARVPTEMLESSVAWKGCNDRVRKLAVRAAMVFVDFKNGHVPGTMVERKQMILPFDGIDSGESA